MTNLMVQLSCNAMFINTRMPANSTPVYIMVLLTLTLLCLGVVVIATWGWRRHNFISRVNKIPGPPTWNLYKKAFKLYCSDRTTHSDIIDWATRYLPQKYGPMVRLWALNHVHILISRAKVAEQIMRKNNNLPKSNSYKMLIPCIGESLVVANGEKWHTYRKIMNPGFNFNMLHKFMPTFNKHALTMTRNVGTEIQNEKGFDILRFTSVCSLDIICETSMGVEIHAQKNQDSPYVKAVNSTMECFTKRYMTPWMRPNFLYNLSSTKRKNDVFLKLIDDFADKVIKERREYLNSLDSLGDDGPRRDMALLDLLLAAEKDHPNYLTPYDIRCNVNTFIVGGYDTVAAASAFVLFLLGTYPEIQDKVVEELVEVFGDSGRLPDVADLANLKYLERCMKESLRLYPTFCFFERAVEEDIEIDGYTIPAGCSLTFNVTALHHDPDIFPDPYKFDPDRFLPENCQGRNTYAYIPFSIGARNCIGQKFATLEEKTVVSTFLRRYKTFAMQDRKDLKLKAGIILHSENIRIRILERDEYPKLQVRQ